MQQVNIVAWKYRQAAVIYEQNTITKFDEQNGRRGPAVLSPHLSNSSTYGSVTQGAPRPRKYRNG